MAFSDGADLLTLIFERQLELQRKSFGIDPINLNAQERADYVRAMALALHVELDEALLEVSWKPWASGVWFNRDAYLMELIDSLHFLINLALVATDDPEEFAAAYFAKADINAARQRNGYTGEKCPTCGRGHDDQIAGGR